CVVSLGAAAMRGIAMRLILEARVSRIPLPDMFENFDYGPQLDGYRPNFHGWVESRGNAVKFFIRFQVTEIDGAVTAECRMAAAKRTEGLIRAAEAALARGQPTFTMEIEQANLDSQTAAEGLVGKVGEGAAPRYAEVI